MSVKLDYLKITSFEINLYTDLLTLIQRYFGGGVRTQIQGYEGQKTEHSFVGKGYCLDGNRNRLPHVLATISGGETENIAQYIQHWNKDFNVKRVDIQATRQSVFDYDKAFELLSTKLNVKLIKSKLATLYIGSRFSDRFIRIYQKDEKTNRFEIEYKGDLAQSAFDVYKDLKLNELFLSEILKIVKRVPSSADQFYPFVVEGVRNTTSVGSKRKNSTETNLDYYANNVRPYVWRALKNPDYSAIIRNDLELLATQGAFEFEEPLELNQERLPPFRVSSGYTDEEVYYQNGKRKPRKKG